MIWRRLADEAAEFFGRGVRRQAQADAAGSILGRDAPGGAVGTAGGANCAALSEGRWRPSPVSSGDDAADPLPSAVVRAERPSDGRGTLRDRLDAAVCRFVAGA